MLKAKTFAILMVAALSINLPGETQARSLEVIDSDVINRGPLAECSKPLHATKGNLGYRIYLKRSEGVGTNIALTFWILDFQCHNRSPQFLSRFPQKKPVYWNILQQNPNAQISMKYYDTETSDWREKLLTRFQRKLTVVDKDYRHHQQARADHKKYYSIYNISYQTFEALSLEEKEQLFKGDRLKVYYDLVYSSMNKFEFQRSGKSQTLMQSLSSDAFRVILTIRLTDGDIEVLNTEVIAH